ncbi:MAG: hypothetical protein Q8L52_02250, partial [bacterium]|nr:hypothetical protein [bacterium]
MFDITQGVSISIMVSKGVIDRKKFATVRYLSMIAKRSEKYHRLETSSIYSVDFLEISLSLPYLRFKPEAIDGKATY